MTNEVIKGNERSTYVRLGREMMREDGIAYGPRGLRQRSHHTSQREGISNLIQGEGWQVFSIIQIEKVCEMQSANATLNIIRERGRKGLPLERIYRQLFNRDLYLMAYGRIYRNHGAMTKGVTSETVDGMSLQKIDTIIEALRYERYRWTPVRRVYIEKKRSKKLRPLGLPTWSDKLLQEVIRLILEAFYEPTFSEHSHGFRPERGCHTALTEIRQNWTGTAWFIEGDIRACFDSVDHSLLLSIVAERIHDQRFLRLIDGLLKAGYVEQRKDYRTLSGTPQGSIVSPILSNIYLSKLDTFVEETLLPTYNHGTKRKTNAAYAQLAKRIRKLRKRGDQKGVKEARKLLQKLPSIDPCDPHYRRLHYVRYADDTLFGFCGPREEAEEIKQQLSQFLRDTLKLEMSQEKTLITHARTEAARFLGYEVTVVQDDHLRDQTGRRATNGTIGLEVPVDVVKAKCQLYQQRGKPIHRKALTHNTDFSIIAQYQQEYRGLVEYYRLAHNLSSRIGRLHGVMQRSLVKTLACKFQISVPRVYKRYKTTIETLDGPRKVLQTRIEREGKKPLVAQWGGISLKWQKYAVLNDNPQLIWNKRAELVQRLLAQTCELCGLRVRADVHHIRALKDLEKPGRAERPKWVKIMAARRRKTLIVCENCHNAIHGGRVDRSHLTK